MKRIILILLILLAVPFNAATVMAAEGFGKIPVAIAENGSAESCLILVKQKTEKDWELVSEMTLKAGDKDDIVLPFEEPGSYEYLVEELPGTLEDVKYDTTKYHIMMTVIVEGEREEPVICVTSDKTDEKATQICFINQRTEKIQTVPKTGDLEHFELWLVLLNLSLSLMIVLLYFRFRNRSDKPSQKGGEK
ncbi:MAG: hypothetical protein IJ744_10755 [Lachnospiraceae bacterium]|nr:hypothetical protein [Lachnospiraceae bacterium]